MLNSVVLLVKIHVFVSVVCWVLREVLRFVVASFAGSVRPTRYGILCGYGGDQGSEWRESGL